MKMTPAYARKILKQLDEQKSYLLAKESSGYCYTAAAGEEPVIPEYDFMETEKQLEEIARKIARIKHAVNVSNAAAVLDVGEEKMTIDVILVRMAQLSGRKDTLDSMRKMRDRERQESYARYGGKNIAVPEYQYLNFDLKDAEREYDRVTKEIMLMQLALDRHNQTAEFEVDL